MIDNKTLMHKYETLKKSHEKLLDEHFNVMQENRELYITNNKLSNEVDSYKRQVREDADLIQTKKVFDVLSNLIKKKESCSYRYLIYDLLGFDKSAYSELINGMTVTNFLVECFDEGKYHDK